MYKRRLYSILFLHGGVFANQQAEMYKRRLGSIGTWRSFWQSVVRNVQKRSSFSNLWAEMYCRRRRHHPGGKFGYFKKLHYLSEFRIVSIRFELRNWLFRENTEFRGRITFFRVITKTVPRLLRGIFPERNFDCNPTSVPAGGGVRFSGILKDEEVLSASIDSWRPEAGRL